MGNPEQFWSEVLAIFLGDVAASILLVPIFLIGRRFVRILGFVDIRIGLQLELGREQVLPQL